MPDTFSPADIAAAFAGSPFIAAHDLAVVSADTKAGTLVVRAPFKPAHERLAGSGQWHGGPIAALIDTVGDFAAAQQLGRPLPTIDLRVDYLRPAVDTDLVVTARVRRSGRTVAVVDVDVATEAGVLVAVGRAVFATVDPGAGRG